MRYSEMKVIEQRRLARTARPDGVPSSPAWRWAGLAVLLLIGVWIFL